MVKVERFEELVAWQKARELTRATYELTRQRAFAGDFGLNGQIQRAAISVMWNIAEGFGRYNRSEFRQFLSIARGSVVEVRSQLHLAKSFAYISEEEFDQAYSLCREVGNLIGGLRQHQESGGAS